MMNKRLSLSTGSAHSLHILLVTPGNSHRNLSMNQGPLSMLNARAVVMTGLQL
jgi:hypothetical protein